jgi:hypothetical protein
MEISMVGWASSARASISALQAVLAIVLGTLLCQAPAARADDAFNARFAQKLGSVPVEPDELANGTRFLEMASTTEVADDIRVYGIQGVAYVRLQDEGEAGVVAVAYYVFADQAQAAAFPQKYIDELRGQAGGWVAEAPAASRQPNLPDIEGRCITTKALDQVFCFFAESDVPLVIHLAVAKPDIPNGAGDEQIKAIMKRRMLRATEDVITAMRARELDAALEAAAK